MFLCFEFFKKYIQKYKNYPESLQFFEEELYLIQLWKVLYCFKYYLFSFSLWELFDEFWSILMFYNSETKNKFSSYDLKLYYIKKHFNSLKNINYKKKKLSYKRKKLGWYYPIRLHVKKLKQPEYYPNYILPDDLYHLTYDLIVNIKKRNLFLTFLDHNKNVLIKNNLGSVGFKDRFKFTSVSLQSTSEFFNMRIRIKLKKIINLIYNSVWSSINFFLKKFYKDNFQINKKIKDVKNKKNLMAKNLYYYLLSYRQIFRFNRVQNQKKLLRKMLKEKHLNIVLLCKTNPKNWSFRFVLKGLYWKSYWYNNQRKNKERKNKIKFVPNNLSICKVLDKRTYPHSNGLRIRKVRRV